MILYGDIILPMGALGTALQIRLAGSSQSKEQFPARYGGFRPFWELRIRVPVLCLPPAFGSSVSLKDIAFHSRHFQSRFILSFSLHSLRQEERNHNATLRYELAGTLWFRVKP